MWDWPVAEVVETDRLVLEPLRPEHAAELAPALDDPELHHYIGGEPASVDALWQRYQLQAVGRSPDGTEGWLNWVVRHRGSHAAVGTVQATLVATGGQLEAALAWVVATGHQRRGYAAEAATAMAGWLRGQGVDRFVADVHPEHRASQRVAERLGLARTDEEVDGEQRWADRPD